jgi:Papain family cysteine protease/Family of unknown function (DUF5719)/IPT/TIG domain
MARKMGVTASSLPSSVDLTLGNMPVGNQGKQGSCVAWAVGYYYKTYQEQRQHGWDASRVDRRFSPRYLYNLINDGEDRGASFPHAFESLIDNGITDLNDCPYDQFDYLTQPTAEQREAAKPYRIADYAAIWRGAGGNDVNQIKARLAAGDPVPLGIPVYQAFYFCQGGWVDSPAPGETCYGNHGICAVGYDDGAGGGQGGIKIVNSWGSDWGAGGYTYLSYSFVSNYVWEAWTTTDRSNDRPQVNSLSPASGTFDTEVTISGDNFGRLRGTSGVRFGTTPAAVTAWNNEMVKAKVPAGVGKCNVSVVNFAGEQGNGKPFQVDLSISGVAPGVTRPGEVAVVDGAGLGTGGTLKLDAQVLEVISWTDDSISFRAPAKPCSGYIKAYQGSKSSNAVAFGVVNSIWYLPEGCTGAGFETWVLVQNPNGTPAHVNITYMTPAGAVEGPAAVVGANSRQTFNVADTVPGEWNVSTRVTSDKPIIAEHAMYGNGRKWGSESVGVEAPARTWYLAEGSTADGFETWILVQNPNSAPVGVQVNYMTARGKVGGPYVVLPGNSRMSFNVADTVNGASGVSTRVDSDKPVIAERSVYWNGRRGGHDSIGVTSPSETWYLAEGSTGGGFETWIPVVNPGSQDARVALTYMTDKGEVKGPTVKVKAGTRTSFFVADTVPNCWGVSTRVTSDQPIVAERSVYWGGRIEGTNSLGVTAAADSWDLAEGSTAPGFETWVLVQNPSDQPAEIAITYMTPKGSVSGPSLKLPANSRKTFFVADTVPNEWSVSTRVTADKPVIAERSMYGNDRTWGHDSVGSPK